MKKTGSKSCYSELRNKELLKTYRRLIGECNKIYLPEILQRLADSTCSRFWVSEQRAAIVLSKMFAGEDVLCKMRPCKQQMFMKLFQKALYVKFKKPEKNMKTIAWEVTNSPAPKFYLDASCIRVYLHYIKKI